MGVNRLNPVQKATYFLNITQQKDRRQKDKDDRRTEGQRCCPHGSN